MSYLECGFEKLSDLNTKRAGEQYHDIDAWSPMQWGCAAAGEMGELCNAVKKLERGRPEDLEHIDALVENIGEEAADVIIYLDLLLKRVNQIQSLHGLDELDLKRCVRDKFNKTSDKIGSKVTW